MGTATHARSTEAPGAAPTSTNHDLRQELLKAWGRRLVPFLYAVAHNYGFQGDAARRLVVLEMVLYLAVAKLIAVLPWGPLFDGELGVIDDTVSLLARDRIGRREARRWLDLLPRQERTELDLLICRAEQRLGSTIGY